MCGITGIVRFDDQQIDQSTLIRMRDALSHRGPDDSGIYANDKRTVAFGHRRLSIIDLSERGHQPMCSEDRNLWIVCNGEIYNFREIRKELESLGHSFSSSSDTEVIINAYSEWGEQCFEKLNGMFALSIYDRRRNLLYLARDHAGIKPLYYSFTKDRLVFSSEVRALKSFDSGWDEFDDWRIYFLTFGHIPEPYTTLKDVFMLSKGSFMRLDTTTGKYSLTKFIELEYSEKIYDESEAIQLVRDTFTRAVERHLISDAPIGVFLSGGIDSSLIALLAHKFQGDNLRTLSVVFDEKEYSEDYYQNIVRNQLSSRHKSYRVTENDFLDNLDDIFESMDQPSIDGINTYFIAKCAKEEGLKSVLSGLGGDELFGGYPSFNRIDRLWFLKDNFLTALFKAFKYADSHKWKKLSFLSMKNPLGYYLLFRGLYTTQVTAEILDVQESRVVAALEKLYFDVQDNIEKKNFVSFLETNLYMQNQLLKDTDSMSMRHSVEVRVPFLDKQLMSLIFSISEEVKYNNKVPKYLLVQAFKDMLPKEVVTRKKQGFTFPFDIWMRRTGRDFFQGAIAEAGINRKKTDLLWKNFESGQLHWARVWGMAVLGKV